jgi:hypothetical protein
VTGLSGTLVLQNNGGDTLGVSAVGTFRFTSRLPTGQSYQVSVASQPTGQHCVVTAGSGVIGSSDIGSVTVHCIDMTFSVGGTVSGLSSAVVLRNGTEELTLTANGSFQFPTPLPTGSAYQATILTQPAGQQCSLSGASGSIASSDVHDIALTCVTTLHVGGTISGLDGTVVLQNNGADDLNISANGSFTFARPFAVGDSYQVTIRAQPANRQCTVISGSGTMTSTDVTSVAVTCVPTFALSGTISGLASPIVLINGADQITVNSDGAFTFAARLFSGDSYAVAVGFPTGSESSHRCQLSEAAGTVTNADITNVSVTCVAKPARYQLASYSSFTSANGVDNPEGTWVLLAEGTLSRGALVAGINPRQDYQLWSRSMVRIRRDPADPSRYFVFTCGPGGSRNTVSPASDSMVYVPFYSTSTSSWVSYGVTITDATTMQRRSVSKRYSFEGDGSSMGWDLSWVLKRISDDPFSNTSTLRDNLLGQTKDVSCIYESEGTYAATTHDGTQETSRVEGLFFWTDAVERHPTQLLDDFNGYSARFYLRDEIGFRTRYGDFSSPFIYRSTDGAVISPSRSFSGTSSSHSVRAVSADGSRVADDTLEVR